MQKEEGQSSSDSEEEPESGSNDLGRDGMMAESRRCKRFEYQQRTDIDCISEEVPSTPVDLLNSSLEVNENLTDLNPSLSQFESKTELDVEVSKQEGDGTEAEWQTTEQDNMATSFKSLKKEKQELEERLQELRETNKSQELENKDLKEKLSEFQVSQQCDSSSRHKESENTEQLKKMLDDAMRKIRKYDFSSDKEEQLKKQKQCLQAQLDRTIADHTKQESILKKEKLKTKQDLKEALRHSQQLEREIQDLQERLDRAVGSGAGEGGAQFDSESEERETKCQRDDDEMSCIINHLDRLLSK